ncbi:Carboxymuconolactone decarboxylase [Segniliparus rotundus DSM 44985]|uniref:Carboxymuconolactone decarboxylase n=1 Tax=Segniliparus rotundus (strain ATCC BAA-972 / CDC 1076 / CIP 108378 / DSM 44985 / JCM 13578) TaxID=640132 RepID=D6ZAD8_SEGRD|nr:carboxymuconolactone decarboxylase family protein [Segniliparus rotundus]ADG96680.1 Carboxymuconolactone decarboxylase [Segniliparus rotundus DSM 44985]
MAAQTRVALGGFRQIGPLAWAIDKAGARRLGVRHLRIMQALGRNKRLFPFFVGYTGYFQGLSKIKLRNVELVILRVAHLRGSAYEWNHHVRLSARAKITAAEHERVAEGPGAAGWSPKEKALLTAVDGFVRQKSLGDEDFAELARHFDEAEIIEILLLTGAYDSLATTIDIIGLQSEYED